MRIPNNADNDFAKKLNQQFAEIEDTYLQSMKPSLTTTEVDVMLQDGSVTKSETFDPQIPEKLGNRGYSGNNRGAK
jgi:hypothetical protein